MSEFLESAIKPVSSKPLGGTQLIHSRVMAGLPDRLKDEFVIIPQKVQDEHLKSKKKKILWMHDLPENPDSAHLKDPRSRARFEKFVFPSNWALWDFHQKLGVPYEDSVVIQNAIVPIPVHPKPKTDRKRIIYFSTPHRGLQILEPVIRIMEESRDDFEVDVFSSFKLYGRDREDQFPEFRDLYTRLRELKSVRYHGTVSNAEIRTALRDTHILAYPSIYRETSCLVAIEAMAAGCLAVVPNYAALPETCKDFASMYQWTPNIQKHATVHYHFLYRALSNFWTTATQQTLAWQIQYYNHFYSMNLCTQRWTRLLKDLSESR